MRRHHATAAICVVMAAAAGMARAAEPGSTAGLNDEQVAARNAWPGDVRMLAAELPEAPTIDGRVDEAAWDAAAGLEVTLNPESGAVFPRRIAWRVGWRDGRVFVAARTPILKGENLVTDIEGEGEGEGEGHGKADLTRTDSYEVWLVPPGSDKAYRAAATSGGTTRFTIHKGGDPANGADWEVEASVDATAKGGSFDAEFALPMGAMGARATPGRAWGFMFVRNFRVGVEMRSHTPVGDPADPSKFGRFVLGRSGPAVYLNTPTHELYDQRARFAGTVRPIPDKPLKLTAAASVTGPAPEPTTHYERRAELPLNDAGAFMLGGYTKPRVEKYRKIDEPYRYGLTIHDVEGREVYHIHFPINTTENRPWVADTIPGHGAGQSKEVVVDPEGPYPDRWRNLMRRYTDLPEGHKVRVTAKRIFDPSNRVHFDAPQKAVAIDQEGQKHGEENFLNHYATEVLKTVTWKHGVKHGPEKHWATANRKRYARTVIPWKDGKVDGVRRTYFPNGQVMVEVTYDNGVPVGHSTTYDQQGRVVRKTQFKDGLRHGERVDFFPPQVRRRIPMKHGEVHGVVKEFDKQGNLVREIPFQHDLQHGVEKTYNNNGEVKETRYWLEGNPVSEREYRRR